MGFLSFKSKKERERQEAELDKAEMKRKKKDFSSVFDEFYQYKEKAAKSKEQRAGNFEYFNSKNLNSMILYM